MAVLDTLRTRLRQSGTVGISDALALEVLDLCQKMFNARQKRVLTSTDITLDANTLLFDIRSKLTNPEGMSIISIKVSDRTLIKLDNWREIFGYSQNWFTETASRHEVWAAFGADMFIVYPAVSTNTTATVVYAGETTVLDETTDTMDIPEEDKNVVYDMAEAILHFHMRNFSEMGAKLTEISNFLGLGFSGTEK